MDGGGAVSGGAEPDLVRPFIDGDPEFSFCIGEVAFAAAGNADADIGQGLTGKGIAYGSREVPGLTDGRMQPKEGDRQYGKVLFDACLTCGFYPQKYSESCIGVQGAIVFDTGGPDFADLVAEFDCLLIVCRKSLTVG